MSGRGHQRAPGSRWGGRRNAPGDAESVCERSAGLHPRLPARLDPEHGADLPAGPPLWEAESDRKPRPVSQQQVTQQFVLPTQPKKEKKERAEREKSDREPSLKKNSHKKMRPRLKNIDRSSAQHLEVTVGDLTVIITDFKEKAKPSATSSSAASATDHHSQNGSSSETTEKGLSRSSSPRGEGSSVNGESH
ncbi:YY1-associated factor 2 isoform X1 [Takifugu flavidus]|uniref:YY1-associated factor 2 isoform X1 n=1 Tax=Takifugu flavidus TaxID=433684 RepID=UPI00254446D3|nr:YY1-associated factor 2 isoform X1 [Takifugu flavidus]XP_056879055.1 YY1-associated factor 2 isoform X1 [Takifugu flavidus]